MARGKKHSPEQVVNALRHIEVAVANGRTTSQACKVAGLYSQSAAQFGAWASSFLNKCH